MKYKIEEIKISYKRRKFLNEVKITTSEKAYKVFLNNWDENTIELFEEFRILLLNNSNEPLGIYTLSSGGMTSTLVDLRLMFGVILKSCATSIITAHNHPSGVLKPSSSDINIYKKIKDIAELHNVNYLDNLIITNEGKFSFSEEGL